VLEFPSVADAYKALSDRRADAVVLDAPVLLHYAAHEGKGATAVVGPVFREEDYGIAFAPGSPLRKRIDGALLAMREDGSYQRLYDKWFATK
jgi:polar amino acid transport system substrate-binding protein